MAETAPTESTAGSSAEQPGDDVRQAGGFVDSDDPAIIAYANEVIEKAGAQTDRDKAVALFYAVRDGWRYDPYNVDYDPAAFKASAILKSSANWCVPKSVLLAALCRAVDIPARLGFADVKNHLQSEKLLATMGTDLFAWHGYTEMWLDGKWRKASSAFNKELCERFGTKVLEFNGVDDALMHSYDEAGNRHMEYVNQRGSYADVPLAEILATFDEVYGDGFVAEHSGERDEAFHG